MKTLQIQKTRWWAWAAAALLLGSASIAQAGWVGATTSFPAAVTTFNGPGYNVTIKDSSNITLYSSGSGAGAFTTDLDGAATDLDPFTTYCVDLNHTLNPPSPSEVGNFNGLYGTRNIGGAAWLLNRVGDLTDLILTSIGFTATQLTNTITTEREAALQIAIWAITYSGTGTSTNLDVSTAAENFINYWTSNGKKDDTGLLVDYQPNSISSINNFDQDQLGALTPTEEIPGVPIPAALFFVAPALLGVLGGMRRKPQGMVA